MVGEEEGGEGAIDMGLANPSTLENLNLVKHIFMTGRCCRAKCRFISHHRVKRLRHAESHVGIFVCRY